LPTLSIDNVSVIKGNSGTTQATFTVSLSFSPANPVTVTVNTADGTATVADNDYQAITNQVFTFQPGGPLTKTVTVEVNGDLTIEPNETFFVKLSNVTGAIIGGRGTGTIVNDDTLSVTNSLDSGPGSLRQALLDAASASSNQLTIKFALPVGQQTINQLTPLPVVTGPLILLLDASQNVTLIPTAGAVWTDNQSLSISGAGTISMGSGIEGTGDLSISAGGSLTATHIIQDALVIGGAAGSPAVVTIAASDSAGNPLEATGTGAAAISTSSALAAPQTGPLQGKATAAIDDAKNDADWINDSAPNQKQESASPQSPTATGMDSSNVDLVGLVEGSDVIGANNVIDPARSPPALPDLPSFEPKPFLRWIDSAALAALMSEPNPFAWSADSAISRDSDGTLDFRSLDDDLLAIIAGHRAV
jgi:hypothetical protein